VGTKEILQSYALTVPAEIRRQESEDGIWLKPANFATQLESLQQSHLPGTCSWFLQSKLYQQWRAAQGPSKSKCLWIQGKPGSGKSVLAAQIIRDLKSLQDGVVTYALCKSGEENKSNLDDILRNIIHQVLCSTAPFKQALHQCIRNVRLSAKTLHAQEIGQLWGLLQQIVEQGVQLYCVIDGLDECNGTAEEQISFTKKLSSFMKSSESTTRLAVISRLDLSESGDLSQWSRVLIQSQDVRDDIATYVSTKMQNSAVLSRHREKKRLQKQLIDNADGMILWVELMIRELEDGCWDVNSVLSKPPKGLEALYTAILSRMSKSAAVSDIRHVLQLCLTAARPFRLDELSMGLALLKGLRSYEDYRLVGNPDREGKGIISKLNPLLTVLSDRPVQLVHNSVREFLLDLANTNSSKNMKEFSFDIANSHGIISLCLKRYLSFTCFKCDSTERTDDKINQGCEHTEDKGVTSDTDHSSDITGHASTHSADDIGQSLLEYSSLYLIFHTARSMPSIAIVAELIAFFKSVYGWRWLQRIQEKYKITYGHLQLMQSELNAWSESPTIRGKFGDVLGKFLLVIAQQRYDVNRSLPEEHEDRLAAMRALARTYTKHGDFKRTEELELQLLETCNRVLGVEHPDTLDSMSNLASTYWNQGRSSEAEQLDVQVLEARKRVLGVEHPETFTSMNNLAVTYSDQGRMSEAEQLKVQVLEVRKRVLGVEHPDTLISMGNLARTYSDQGRSSEAEQLKVQVLEIRKRVLGVEHPNTLLSMANLARTYSNQGRRSEAEQLEVQVLEVRKRVLGGEHPDTLISMANLARTYSDQGRSGEAEQLEVQVLEIRKRVLGVEHPGTLTSMSNLASTYSDQGRSSEAEQLEVQVLEVSKRALGVEHPDTLTSMANLAFTYSEQGRASEAEQLEVQVLEVRKRVLGAEHPQTLTSMANLAVTYRSQGRHDKAVEMMRQVVDLRTKKLSSAHPDTVEASEFLGSWLHTR
jgi:tetratricopeptide (TPR) repeat protein